MNIEEEENKVLKLLYYLQIRGGGLAWALLYWILYYLSIKIMISTYKLIIERFTLQSLILGGLLFVALGILFTYMEIKRIRILQKYNNATKDYLKRQSIDFKDVMSLFNSMRDIYDAKPRNENGFEIRFSNFQKATIEFKKKYFQKEDD